MTSQRVCRCHATTSVLRTTSSISTTGPPSRPTTAETTPASVAGTGSFTRAGRQPDAVRVVTTSPRSSRYATVGVPCAPTASTTDSADAPGTTSAFATEGRRAAARATKPNLT